MTPPTAGTSDFAGTNMNPEHFPTRREQAPTLRYYYLLHYKLQFAFSHRF